jgi:PKD repeat protein
VVTSAPTQNICSNNTLNYNITSNNTGTTYTWTASVTAGSVSGFSANGNTSSITDVLVNNTPNVAGEVTYVITPTTNGCPGTSSNFTVTIPALPVVTAAAASPAICSNSPAGITITSNQTGTRYTWTVNAPAGITGATAQPTPIATAAINNTLVNNTTGVLRVTYTITPYNSANCAGTPVPVFVDVNPPTPVATVGPNQNLCNETQTTLTGNDPGASFTGQWTQTSGPAVTITTPNNFQTTVTGLVSGQNYTFIWTINGIAPCGPTSAQINIVNNAATVGGTTSAPPAATTVCAGNNSGQITLSGNVGAIQRWERSTDNGVTWTTVTPASTSNPYVYTNLNTTTQFRAVVRNGPVCSEVPSAATTVTVNPPVPPAVAGANQVLCNLTTTTLDATPPGGSFVGQWSQTGGPPGVIFANINDPRTQVSGLILDSVYTFTWTILATAPCTNNSASMTVLSSAPTVAGSISANTTVCAGENGQVTITGHRGNILYWERSEDTGANWIRINITTATLSYTNIRQTTQFRAYVQNGNCNILISPLTVVTVNQPPPPADAGPNQILCNQPSVNLVANNPGTFVGRWRQISGPAAVITDSTNYQTTVTGLTGASTYVFRWTITALAPCVDTYQEVTITNNPDVVASFTANTKVGCGNLTVQFTNTSNNQTGANFIWNFGDGQTSTVASPQHTFAQRTDGRDTTYYISLGVLGNCLNRPAIVDSILVRPATPLARILPASTAGCGNYAIDIRNTSPGNNVSYVFYLYDGNTLVQTITKTDKTNAIFDPITTTARKVFTVYMVATGYCNNTNETTHIPVTISPSDVVAQMVIQGGINAGCAPLNTTFINNSFGGDNFYYNIYDANNNLIDRPLGGTTPLPYRFSTTGTYYVTITAISNCGMVESPRTRVDVYATPTPGFVADITSACKYALITFSNNTISNDPNTPVTSLLYDWDFGDGSPHSALFAPTHAYHFTGTAYTVTLRATNTTSGCTQVFVRTAYINLYGPPKTAFDIRPDSVTSIPNYTFSFIDRTPADAVSWRWTFGDGQTSTSRNPTVTYPDTGVYRVTLTTATATGCDSTITRTVRIGGVPGQLFLPNAFMPESATTELRTFMAKGSGIKTWHLQIFNNYGQLVWQTTKLSPKGEPEEGWDGTFKGVPAPQGVYQWQASATFINGTEWKGNSYRDELPKRVGSVHLIR